MLPSKFSLCGVFPSEALSTHKHLKYETSLVLLSQERVCE